MSSWLHPGRLLRAPRAVLCSLLLITLLLIPLALRLRLEGSIVNLLPRSSPSAQTFASFTRHLVAGQELIVLVTCEDPRRLLEFADAYAQALRRIPDAQRVTYRISSESAAYLRDHLLMLLDEDEQRELQARTHPDALRQQVRRLRALLSAPGGSSMAPLLTADPLELVPLISKRLSSGLPVDAQSGYFRTQDGKALLIKVRPGFDPWDIVRDRRLLDQAGAAARALGARVQEGALIAAGAQPVVSFTGSYAYPPYYRAWLEQDLKYSTMLSIGAVLLLFALFFRALRILPVVLLPLLCAGVWTAAAAALLFGRVNGVSLAFGTILVAIGIDLPIQLYNRLREELLLSGSAAEAVPRTLQALAGPSVLATLGPAVVFFCCGLSDYRGLNELGILAGVGLCLNCVSMLTLFPALLLILPQRFWYGPRQARADRHSFSGGLLMRVLRPPTRHPKLTLLLCAGLLLCSLPFAARLSFDQKLFALEPKAMPPALAQAEIGRRFGDRQRFLAVLIEDPDKDRALWRADQWAAAAERLRQRGLLRGYEALGTLLPAERTQAARRAALQRLDLPRVAGDLAQILDEEGFTRGPFAGFLAQLTQPLPALTLSGLQKTEMDFLIRSHMADVAAEPGHPARRVVALYLFAPADTPLGPLLSELSALTRGEVGGALTGMPLLEEELRRIVERDTRLVTATSVVLVGLLLVLFYRRGRPIAAVLLPLLLAWVLCAASMVILHLPLNLYNLLAIPLCIGYGIDDHVFLVHRHLHSPTHDPVRTLVTTGRAIILTSLSTMAGFLGLLVAHFEGLRLLGLSGALVVFLCLFSAFAALPALLSWLWPPRPM